MASPDPAVPANDPALGWGDAAVVADWHTLAAEGPEPPLRCWWARPRDQAPRAAILVLPEVFGINGWVRSVAERLASQGYAALAMPLFARTAPDLELDYSAASLQEGRSHKERTRTDQLLLDCGRAVTWLQGQRPGLAVGCVGFCFGGHAALLAATLPSIGATCDFYGAGVATGRPGGGPPSLALVPAVQGRLLCVCGTQDPLIPSEDVAAIGAALAAVPRGVDTGVERGAGREAPHQLLRLEAGHGFLCEARADFQPEAAREGWRAMLSWFEDNLP